MAEVHAQDASELAAARRLFAEGLADQQAQHFAMALEKFQKVQAVRDTQAVRYRVANCLEALGKLKAALEAYTAASVASGTDAESTTIARVSREKMDALTGRVARVVLKLSLPAPDDARVMIDNDAVQANAIGTPIVIDPGVHEITATGTGAASFHAQTTLVEGGMATIEVTLEVPRHAPPLPPMDTLSGSPATAPPAASASAPASESESTGHPGSGRMTAGIVTVSVGGALLVGSVVLLLKQHSDIGTINDTCLGGTCPLSQQSELESIHSRALWEGPLGVGLGIAGIVSAGVGIYLLATPTKTHAASAFTPWVDRSGGGAAWRGTF